MQVQLQSGESMHGSKCLTPVVAVHELLSYEADIRYKACLSMRKFEYL